MWKRRLILGLSLFGTNELISKQETSSSPQITKKEIQLAAKKVAIKRREQAHAQMLKEIKQDTKDTSFETGVSDLSPRVWDTLKKVERHFFVPLDEIDAAYINHPLSIGEGQTISQPFIVAIMTELLDVKKSDNVLEIGTGSGYQAAVLSHLAKQVYTIEIFESLAKKATALFKELGYKNIFTLTGNGAKGWKEHAPYDKIIVTASAKEAPPVELLEQLKPGGIMVIPLTQKDGSQVLAVVKKSIDGKISTNPTLPVRFVPFLGLGE